MDERCVVCWRRESEHVPNSSGLLECPQVVHYFTPCKHPSSRGWGSISHGGVSDVESWCDVCGKQLVFKRSSPDSASEPK
jgi:hypothetical protein